MFKSIKRLVFAATMIVAMSAPSAAYAFIRVTGGGPATGGQGQSPIVSSVPRVTASAYQGFQWGDAGVGAGVIVALLAVGAGATLVIRRRVHQPVAG
jgi:hypothetical protein